MRASLTPLDALLWSRIRGRQLGPVFRRQVPLLGRFIADFLAPVERLVIEVDGAHHAREAGPMRAVTRCWRAPATACSVWTLRWSRETLRRPSRVRWALTR